MIFFILQLEMIWIFLETNTILIKIFSACFFNIDINNGEVIYSTEYNVKTFFTFNLLN